MQNCSSRRSEPLKRPRYFPRQLITPAEMNLEQAYFRERLRLHNRMLHGWGVVCGAMVCPVFDSEGEPRPWCVAVEPGYLLDPCGEEIYIDCEVKVDLRKACVAGATGDPCLEDRDADFRDPWCSEVYVKREGGPLYVAVRYREILARPVPVQPVGCGCDEAACEYSRWCDGYEICVLPECPENHRSPPILDNLFRGGRIPACPDCPDERWVALAKVEIDANGIVKGIDNCSCRRLVASLAHFWWPCDSVKILTIEPDTLTPGTNSDVTITGGPFPEDVRLSVDDMEVSGLTVPSETEITAKFKVSEEAEPGPRRLILTDADGRCLAWKEDAFEVVEAVISGERVITPAAKKATGKRRTKKTAKKKSGGRR